jgi:hypothetical protein
MNLAEWFALRDKDLPKPKWNYGDRVFAKKDSHPLVGYVIREDVIEKRVLIHSDLPIASKKEIRHIVWVPVKGIKALVEIK